MTKPHFGLGRGGNPKPKDHSQCNVSIVNKWEVRVFLYKAILSSSCVTLPDSLGTTYIAIFEQENLLIKISIIAIPGNVVKKIPKLCWSYCKLKCCL